METEQELQQQLLQINTALQQLISGERITRVEVGSPEFRKVFEHAEVTIEALQNERNTVQRKLKLFSAEDIGTQFRDTSHQISWRKF